MRAEIANLVYELFGHALSLKDRLKRGEPEDLLTHQQAFFRLLNVPTLDPRWADGGGARLPAAGSYGAQGNFLGARYALACWLDEIFIFDSPWSQEWEAQALEPALFSSRDRAFNFWDQARLAEAQGGTDALEIFYLCVMFGFRGDLRDAPDKLRDWRYRAEQRIGQEPEWPIPPESDPPSDVPFLSGRDILHRMIVVVWIVLGFLIPAVTFLLVRKK